MGQVQQQEQAQELAPGQEYARIVGGAGRKAFNSAAFPDANRTALAEACGVTMSHLCKIFHGQGRPSLPLARKLAQAMGLSVEAFSAELDAINSNRNKKLKRKGKRSK